jgi:hypothetical protein
MDGLRQDSSVAALLDELDRIGGRADTERAAADQAVIRELRRAAAELRRAVAQRRAGGGPLHSQLPPVVARAGLATAPGRVDQDPADD